MADPRPLLELDAVFQHVGPHCALRDLSLRVHAGETLLILGANGAGKTLLVRLILGLDQPSAGRVRLFGKDLAELDDHGIRTLRRRVGAVLQRGALIDDLSVLENLLLPLRNTRMDRRAMARASELAVALFRLDGFENQCPPALSIGQRRRVELARALINRPHLLVWDGLADGLDLAASREIAAVLEPYRRQGLTLIATSHRERGDLGPHARVLVLERGQILFDGSRGDLEALSAQRLELRHILRGHP